ncbi:MAG: FAD-binding oxidoreductase [Rhodospirillaceae bacterium]|nr:FAD-binding oxidoreductase [Rhodospirillaceae bacterium]
MYRVAVIGRGLIGSAAARHLTEMTDGVVVIGPDEPAERSSHTGVFASHYDEGRMARIVDPMPEWSITAKRSIARFGDLERRSGIAFFTPAGYLGLGGPGMSYNDACAKAGATQGATLRRLDAAQIRTAFPFLNVPDDADGLTETGSAGYISPRGLVAAQTEIAAKGGAVLVRDAAQSLRPVSGGIEIATMGGDTVKADKVIVATGAFTQAWGLIQKNLNLKVYGRTVVLARIDEDLLSEFDGMPTMIHCESDAYILPPIRYPDGHHYLKLGNGSDRDERLSSPEKLDRWFKSAGSESDRRDFTRLMKSIFPALQACEHWHTDTCATTYTASRLPIIDFVYNDRVLVAVGGCGKGAKGSDDWGRIAATTILDAPWDHPIARDKLRFS